MVAAFRERRDVIVDLLQAIPGVTCAVPDGAFYAFPNVKGVLHRSYGDRVITSSLDLSRFLLESVYVATVPGEAFGLPGYLRLSYACDMETIHTGLARITEALARN
jgi:aspartate aminotransferase